MFGWLKKEKNQSDSVDQDLLDIKVECKKLMRDFEGHLSKAHSYNYVQFKVKMHSNLEQLENLINDFSTKGETDIQYMLYKKMKSQLTFLTKNPFSVELEDFEYFKIEHLPFNEKVVETIANFHKAKKQSMVKKLNF